MRDRARNSISGRKAQVAGSSAESWLDAQHEIALRLGILARIDKIDPPAVVRNGKVEFGERTGADYVGMLGSGLAGKPVYGLATYCAIESKSTLKEYLPRAEVKKEQQRHLDEVARGGGLALLVVEFRGEPSAEVVLATGEVALRVHGGVQFNPAYRRYCVPWQDVPWQVLKTAQSVSEEALAKAGWQVQIAREGSCYLERFHPRGTPTAAPKGRIYARE